MGGHLQPEVFSVLQKLKGSKTDYQHKKGNSHGNCGLSDLAPQNIFLLLSGLFPPKYFSTVDNTRTSEKCPASSV